MRALINVAGVHLKAGQDQADDDPNQFPAQHTFLVQGTSAFSAPITLDTGCGVGRMTASAPNAAGHQTTVLECGFEDVNGDGLADRVNQAIVSSSSVDILANVVRLGTGNHNAPFSDAFIQLPGPLLRSEMEVVAKNTGNNVGNHKPKTCPDSGPSTFPYPSQTYQTRRTAGMRDLNGDGIPDFIALDPTGAWTVAMGTGAGFGPQKSIDSSFGFELSVETVGCFSDNPTAGTVVGLYEIDGDGVPELVTLSNGGLFISKVNAALQEDNTLVPATSGRLSMIDNGYGALTFINYCSAKEDAGSHHSLPYPEMVVCSTSSFLASDPSQSLAAMRYAYGSAEPRHFDAACDCWVFRGYERRVSLQNTGDLGNRTLGKATISDAYSLDPSPIGSSGWSATDRFLRYAKAGRPMNVTTVSGMVGTDAWALLAPGAATNPGVQIIGGSFYSWQARLLPVGRTGNEYCVDMLAPYNYDASLAYDNNAANRGQDQCAQRGFVMQNTAFAFRGDGLISANAVSSGSQVTGFDDFGRVTDSVSHGGQDLCTHTDYGAPVPDTPVHVLSAVATRTVTDCHDGTLTKVRFEYDGKKPTNDDPVVRVSDGFVTSSTVTRYDLDTHNSLGDIRQFDKTYNPDGTLKSTTRTRGDGATQTDTIDLYDGFGLVGMRATSRAFDPVGGQLPEMIMSNTYDPVTLQATSATDTNGTVRGTSYDGFGRQTLSKVTQPGGSEGILSSTTYAGFELSSHVSRSISQKVFTDAVTDVTASGRISLTYMDGLGRTTKTETQLGTDYQNQTLVVGRRIYDPLGRVKFEAAPFVADGSDTVATRYGTSYNYNTDGTPSCFVRGTGVQPSTFSVNETTEVYPTCFTRTFAHFQEILTRQDPDTFLPNTAAVLKETFRNAIGQTVEARTRSSGADGGSTTLEDVVFGYDALGNRTSMTRYQNPTSNTGAVNTTWHYDSLGQVTKLEEDGVAARTRTHDSFGNVTQVQWCDDRSAAPCPTKDRRTIARYDARNRLSHREDQANNSGQPVPGTAADFSYDVNSGALPFVPRNNMLGRLASATWGTGQEWFTYDAFGRVNSRSFIDTSVMSNDHHYEIHEFHDDGSEKTLHLELQDTNGQDERVNYGYDSAGRVNSAVYSFGGSSQTLFAASGTSPIYDAFGRIKTAKYGLTQFNANFLPTGRRLPDNWTVTSADHAHSREIVFPLFGAPPFDPVGRERVHSEIVDGHGVVRIDHSRSYDQLGRLSRAHLFDFNTNKSNDRNFNYDPLNNIVTQTDPGSGNPGSVSLSYGAPDLDRICGLAYAGATAPQSPCNVSYDGAGNTLTMPTRTGTRTLEFFPSGAVKSLAEGASNASFAYDALGALQQLTVNTPSADRRADKYFGSFIKQRVEGAQSVINRQLPTPGGVIATLHGPSTGKWTFAFGEGRGTRFVTDQTGNFVQGIDYQPFGEVKNPSGATPGMTNYTSEQFNGGDLLAAFGVVNLGKRIYDPVIGRFLSRDPLLIPRTAATTNPYAFSHNDPINKLDPSGMDPQNNQANPRTHAEFGYEFGCTISPLFCDHDSGSAIDNAGAGDDVTPGYVWKHTPGDGYEEDPETHRLTPMGDPNLAFVDPFRKGTRCNKSCHPGSDGGQDPRFPARNGEATASFVLGLGFAAATFPYGAAARLFAAGRGLFAATSVDAASVGANAVARAAAEFSAEEVTWRGLAAAPNGGAGLTEAELGRHYVGQVISIVRDAPAGEQAALLERLVRADLPQALGGHNYSWSALAVPGQSGLYYGVQAGTAAGLPAIGVRNGLVYAGRAPLADLIKFGTDALKAQ